MTCKTKFGSETWTLNHRKKQLTLGENVRVFALRGYYQGPNAKVRWQPPKSKSLYNLVWISEDEFELNQDHDRQRFLVSDWDVEVKAYKFYHISKKYDAGNIDALRAQVSAKHGKRGDGELFGFWKLYDILDSSPTTVLEQPLRKALKRPHDEADDEIQD
jgi:hypothetical protein